MCDISLNNPNVLFVVAHPDDIILGSAGLLIHLCRTGARIAHLSLTDGGRVKGMEPDARVRELERIYRDSFPENLESDTLRMIQGNLTDGMIPATGEPVPAMEGLIRERCPDWNFDLAVLHWPDDWHIDHINASRIGHRLARNIPSVLYFESWSSMNFVSALCLNVTRYWDERLAMMDRLRIHPQPRARPRLEGRAMYHGDTIRTEYAEAFATSRFDMSVLSSTFLSSNCE